MATILTEASTLPSAAGGLTSAEAAERLARFGANEVAESRERPLLRLLHKLWSPVPWMLEASVLLELVLGHRTQALIVLALLVSNALLGFLQEDRARKAIELLRARLQIRARALRDGVWATLSARELVPGDVVRLRVGDVTPADCRLLDGALLEDRSVVTGESLAQEVATGDEVFSGTTLRRGEATAEVLRTGTASRFGKTAELVRAAGAAGHIEKIVLGVVKVLVVVDALVAAVIVARAVAEGAPPQEIVPFVLMLLVASVPVALPATITLATALGSRDLAARGVLVAKLPAVESAASLDVLCCDKTGTLTKNELAVARLLPSPGQDESELLRLAAWASDPSTRDPIDVAILEELSRRGLALDLGRRRRFVPFEPATKRSEAIVELGPASDGTLRILKGAPPIIGTLVGAPEGFGAEVERLSAGGIRVLAIAAGPEGSPKLAGLIGLADPPRVDSKETIARLEALGLRVIMITGDSVATARDVAGQVGVSGTVLRAAELRERPAALAGAGVVAEVFPEDKFEIVRTLQQQGHLAGMTGDGVNDAPALKQADVGVAVAGATDVARAAAGMVLVGEGISGILQIVEIGRRIHQRLLTYTLNKIVKTLQTVLFLGGWYLFDGTLAVTPRLIVLLLFANDFVTMSLATDRVGVSRGPERWRLRALSLIGLAIASLWVAFSVAALLVARRTLHFDLPRLQTLSFLLLVFTGQGTVYLIRGRERVVGERPSLWLALSSLWAIAATSALAALGWLMAPLPPRAIGMLALATLAFTALLALSKLALGGWLGSGPPEPEPALATAAG